MESFGNFQNCRGVRCPFEPICRNSDTHSDRSNGCETRDFIVVEAQKLMPTGYIYTPVQEAPETGLSKLQKVKILRSETGSDLKTCVDALDYADGDLPRARDYIKYGW